MQCCVLQVICITVCRREQRELRRLEAKLARESAAAASEGAVRGKHRESRARRAAAAEAGERLRDEVAARRRDNARRRDFVAAERARMHDAVAAVSTSNARAADAVRGALHDSAAALAREREAERAQRADLIRQLRAAERVPAAAATAFDPTQTAGHGLLEEMSVLVRPALLLGGFSFVPGVPLCHTRAPSGASLSAISNVVTGLPSDVRFRRR